MLLYSPAMTRFALIVALLAACGSKKSDHGLAPADDWNANPGGAADPAAPGNNPHGAAAANPHAIPSNQNTDELPDVVDENGNNPHAGLKRNTAGGGAGPMGMDPSTMNSLAPDPNRKIDPSHKISGTINVAAKLADKAKAGSSLFVIVKQADATGAPIGTPLAVDKLQWDGKPLPYEVTEGQAMVNGTQMTGDVVVTVRLDQDGDAISKQPGDLVGTAKVKVPSTAANVSLDTVLP